MLKQLGYVAGNLNGARILRIAAKHPRTGIPFPDTYIAPYMDDMTGANDPAMSVELDPDDDKYLIVGPYKRSKSIEGSGNTSGLVGAHSHYTREGGDGDENGDENPDNRDCYECGGSFNMDDMAYSDTFDRWLCVDCCDQYYKSAHINSCDLDYIPNRDTFPVLDADGNRTSMYIYRSTEEFPTGLTFLEYPSSAYALTANSVLIDTGVHEGKHALEKNVIRLLDSRTAVAAECFPIYYKNKRTFILRTEYVDHMLHIFASKATYQITYRDKETTETQFVDTWSIIHNHRIPPYFNILESSLHTKDIVHDLQKAYVKYVKIREQKTKNETDTEASIVPLTKSASVVDFDQMA